MSGEVKSKDHSPIGTMKRLVHKVLREVTHTSIREKNDAYGGVAKVQVHGVIDGSNNGHVINHDKAQ